MEIIITKDEMKEINLKDYTDKAINSVKNECEIIGKKILKTEDTTLQINNINLKVDNINLKDENLLNKVVVINCNGLIEVFLIEIKKGKDNLEPTIFYVNYKK